MTPLPKIGTIVRRIDDGHGASDSMMCDTCEAAKEPA